MKQVETCASGFKDSREMPGDRFRGIGRSILMQACCKDCHSRLLSVKKARHRNPESGVEDDGMWHVDDVDVVTLRALQVFVVPVVPCKLAAE